MKNKLPGFLRLNILGLLLMLSISIQLSSQESNARFKAQTIDSTVSIGYGIALGDVDGDGKPDILLADKKQFAWYRNGDWKKFVIAENITELDNVCIAAADIDGDGKVEVAAGAQWNPGETTDKSRSGSVHFLIRPKDPTQKWDVRTLYHEPTIHRMRWMQSGGHYYLAVLPLHGEGNKDGNGAPVNLLLYKYPDLLSKTDPSFTINTKMHLAHNFDVVKSSKKGESKVFVGGKEGIGQMETPIKAGSEIKLIRINDSKGAGEVRVGKAGKEDQFLTAVEPMHGQQLVVYSHNGIRQLLDSSLNEGHAVATADFLGTGADQVVVGWRKPNKDGAVGVKFFFKTQNNAMNWESEWIDKNGMACEDLQAMDLDGDGKPDIIASGRQSNNLKIYWNVSGKK